jgi:peptidoglycan/LPS O-acetylase OafA/YrhL
MTPGTVDSLPRLAKTFEPDLDSLRGFAALLVCLYHAFGLRGYLDPGYTPAGIGGYQFPGHFCVLLFFVLSGYVIGLSTPSRLTLATAGTYLHKRFVRLYPIYAVCLVLALLVASAGAPAWKAILGNFLFLHVVRVATIQQLAPAWSLQYEVVLYLFFLPISFLQLPVGCVVVGALVVGLLNMYLRPAAPLLSSYAFSFVFWGGGLACARHAAQWPWQQPTPRLQLSVLLLLLSFPAFSPDWLLKTLLVRLCGHDLTYHWGLDMFESQLAPHDLVYLPFAVLGVLVFTHRHFPRRSALLPTALLVCGLSFIPMVTHWPANDHPEYRLSSGFYLAAVGVYGLRVTFLERLGQVLLAWLRRAGAFSYALYLVHFPLLCAFQRLTWFAGSALSYWVRLVGFLLLSFATAAWLEQQFQPWARAWLAQRLPRPRQ